MLKSIDHLLRKNLQPSLTRPLGPFKIKVNHQLAMTVRHHFDVTTRYAIDVTLWQFLGSNYGKIKNQTNFERAKMYEDVDQFA